VQAAGLDGAGPDDVASAADVAEEFEFADDHKMKSTRPILIFGLRGSLRAWQESVTEVFQSPI
jgi:hypothetical protein